MPKNSGKKWSSEDEKKLKQLAKGNTPTRIIGLDRNLGRSEAAIYKKARQLGVSLKPINQSPYGSGKKKKNKQ